jgi:hypothetical protein
MNVYEQILHDAERTTAQAWQQHEPLTALQLDRLTEFLQPGVIRRSTERIAVTNLVTLATAHPVWVVERDPYGVIKAHKPGQPALRLVSGERHCSKCGEWLPSKAFNRDSGRKDGLDPYCRSCRSHANAERYAMRRAS